MISRTLTQADAIYNVAVAATLQWEAIENEPFEAFSTVVQDFQRSVGKDTDDTIWLEVVRRLRAVRSALSAAPLPFNHSTHQLPSRLEELSSLFARARAQHSGEPLSLFRDALLGVQELAGLSDNPLGDRALELTDAVAVGGRGLLVPVSRLVQPVSEAMRRRPSGAGLKVLSPAELVDSGPLEILVIVGSTYWYSRYPFVFSAPRARCVHMLKWGWINDSLPSPELLISSRSGSRQVASEPVVRRRRNAVAAEDVAPSVDWMAIADRVGRASEDHGEIVDASILLLAQGWAVAISAEVDSTVRVVEPDLVGDQRIQEIPAAEVEEGDYILLRSHGGGELIVALADKDLGERAVSLRSSQRTWKDALRAEVRRSSPAEVVRRLKKLGSPRANYLNLRNWQSARFLRTHDPADFNAIMTLVGMGDAAQSIWEEMGVITNAHRRAGHRITKLLREAVAEADLSSLVSKGVMEFQLEGQDVGNLTVCRVDAVAPTTTEVNEHSVGRRVPAEDLWLA